MAAKIDKMSVGKSILSFSSPRSRSEFSTLVFRTGLEVCEESLSYMIVYSRCLCLVHPFHYLPWIGPFPPSNPIFYLEKISLFSR